MLMEASGNSSEGNGRRYGINIAASNFLQAPLTALLEYSGILGANPSSHETEALINRGGLPSPRGLRDFQNQPDDSNPEEVSIMIIGAAENENYREANGGQNGSISLPSDPTFSPSVGSDASQGGGRNNYEGGVEEGVSTSPILDSVSQSGADGEPENVAGASSRDSSSQRYDIQHFARRVEQILPFSLLLLLVFIRQHLQGFLGTIWIAVVLFKSNETLRKQTALKEERKISYLVGIFSVFMLHVVCVYWWYRNDDLFYPLIFLPPKAIPPFWDAIFIIVVNDIMVRQAGMSFKCLLLMYYKNSRGRDYRKQGQMLTLVEYLLLLYRALLPAPVWYRFFLNKEYGSLFSSLTTGLYLTLKLTSVVKKVQLFVAASRALSRKELHYGSHATSEQVNAAGDLCAICQEKMHAPILLGCKHIFCEDCVSEWFEQERTCPLCRALVKPADIRSYGDGSTNLFLKLF